MNWFLTIVLCIALIELLLRLPVAAIAADIGLVSRKSVGILTARRISDHWKEKALLAYSRTLFVASVKLGGVLAIAGGTVALFVYVSGLLGATLYPFLLSWPGLLFSLVAASLYLTVRKRLLPAPQR